MSQINIRNLSNENDDGAPDIVGITTVSSTSYFVPPVGTTVQRPENPQGGDLRFNTDTASLEYFRGDTLGWSQIEMTSPDLDGGARGLFASGQVAPSTGTYTDHIEYVTISTLGNGNTFGDLTVSRGHCAGMASRSRAVFGSGYGPSNVIDYITIASTGDALDFGDNTTTRDSTGGISNQTRGLIAGGSNPVSDIITYITIAQKGNAVEFGDLTRAHSNIAAAGSSTRGICAGGGASDVEYNTIDYVTIHTTGNATDFGDLTYAKTANCSGGANSTRMIVVGGTDTPGYSQVNTIEYITIATLGNATDFGDTSGLTHACAVMASPTRAVIKLGNINYPNTTNVIEYVEFATTGNTTDFGDSVNQTYGVGEGISNAHGGL